jgi:hypothetical protein
LKTSALFLGEKSGKIDNFSPFIYTEGGKKNKIFADIAQLVERLTCNQEVESSILSFSFFHLSDG